MPSWQIKKLSLREEGGLPWSPRRSVTRAIWLKVGKHCLLLSLKGRVPRAVLGDWVTVHLLPQRHQLGCRRPLVAGERVPAINPSSCITYGPRNHRH